MSAGVSGDVSGDVSGGVSGGVYGGVSGDVSGDMSRTCLGRVWVSWASPEVYISVSGESINGFFFLGPLAIP